jgi:hypothetical protein
VTNQGSGYSGGTTATVTAPDFPSGSGPFPNGSQATATPTVSGGKIISVFSTYGGYGYFQPQITFAGGPGAGATATPVVTPLNVFNQNQEVYNFSDIDVTPFPGCGTVYHVRTISVIYANYRYTLYVAAFSDYQAVIRQYPFQYQYVPAFAAQFGQGTAGSLFVYPLPSQTYQWEADCLCLPQDLTVDASVEIIPDPWTDAVKYFTAHLAYLDIQNFNAAKFYLELFDMHLQRYSNYARIGRAPNRYGRI